MLQGIPINKISEEDVQGLVDDKIEEGKNLDYKEKLEISAESDKKDFLRDVIAFANTQGGDIVYGISEERDSLGKTTGVPRELIGIDNENLGQERDKLEKMINSGISPKLPGVAFQEITLQNGKKAFLVRVPRSWNGPHMVTYQSKSDFYKRISTGKEPMDIQEIKDAFLLSETVFDKIRAFRKGRLDAIENREIHVPLVDGPAFVFHLIPIEAFRSNSLRSIDQLEPTDHPFTTIDGTAGLNTINIDGILLCDEHPKKKAYTQIYRNGIIESVGTNMFFQKNGLANYYVKSVVFEAKAINLVKDALQFAKRIGITPPLVMFYGMLGAKSAGMSVSPRYLGDAANVIDRNRVETPELMIDTYDVSIERTLKPCFDAIWNSAGWRGSLNYDKEGNWRPHDDR